MGRSGGYLRSLGPVTAAGLATGALSAPGLGGEPAPVGTVIWACSAALTNTTIAGARATEERHHPPAPGHRPLVPGPCCPASESAGRLIAGLQGPGGEAAPCRRGCGSPERSIAAPRAARPQPSPC